MMTAPVALITGSARRIGAAIARYLHQRGWNLALHAHQSLQQLQDLSIELNDVRPRSVLVMHADLRDTARLPGLVKGAVTYFGHLDGLINNASAFFPTPVGDVTAEQWEALFAVNAQAPLFLAQAAAPYLRQRRGAIVNISDLYASQPLRHHPIYCASKAALEALTASLALELAPEVRVNALAPGAILWALSGKSITDQQALLARTPLARLGTVEEVAAAVHWLLHEAHFVSGQVIRVDGGRLLS